MTPIEKQNSFVGGGSISGGLVSLFELSFKSIFVVLTLIKFIRFFSFLLSSLFSASLRSIFSTYSSIVGYGNISFLSSTADLVVSSSIQQLSTSGGYRILF